MGRALALLLAALASAPQPASAAPRRAGAAAHVAQPRRPAARAKRGSAPTLAAAKQKLEALARDRTKRRYRHHWERAIAALERAARGKDTAPALVEASRARYALYRWSANEADRDHALRLASRAAKLGSRDAKGLLAAIRREAGDDREVRAPAPRGAAAPADRGDDESARELEPDPALEAALADVSPSRASALRLGASAGEGTARVTAVRSWSDAEYTRIAVYLTHWVGWQKLELDARGELPRRLALDLRPAALAGGAQERKVAGDQVDRVRVAQHDPETVRVVLDLPGDDRVQLFALDDPPRLIVDVGTHAARRSVASTPPTPTAPPPSAPAPGATSPRAQPVVFDTSELEHSGPVRRIVVDAGHGGHDPGAIGARRIREKDVTLAIARRLAKRLRAAGFEVVLTRKDDRYLALEERTAIANTARGDLFVSIHANAHPRRNRSGVETYVLNVADDRYAARLAARENGVELEDRGEGDATRILTDLDAKASAGSSRRLAGLVQRELTSGVRARVGEVRDLGVKSALFYVLLGARMPAVLVETAFISNRVEERRLASARYQEEVAAGITRAVTAFARSEARVAAR
jgi:N-acetylmuramoyl-L-alanine amidase